MIKVSSGRERMHSTGPPYDSLWGTAGSKKETSFLRAKALTCSKYSSCRYVQRPSRSIKDNSLNSHWLSKILSH
jgi:hypothetical protein